MALLFLWAIVLQYTLPNIAVITRPSIIVDMISYDEYQSRAKERPWDHQPPLGAR
jgi:hypothetical protein